MDAINRREHLTHIRRLPVHRAEHNLGQEVKIIVLEERPHADSLHRRPRAGPDALTLPWISRGDAGQHFFNVADAHINTNWRFLPTNDAMIDHMNDAFSAAIAANRPLQGALADVQAMAIEDMKAKDLKVRAA